MLKITTKENVVRFEVHAKPRAKRSEVRGEREGALEVSIAAPPADGAANEELIRLLSDLLGVPKSRIAIVRGDGARNKLIEVRGVTEDDLRARLIP